MMKLRDPTKQYFHIAKDMNRMGEKQFEKKICAYYMGVNILQIFDTDLCEVIEKEFEF